MQQDQTVKLLEAYRWVKQNALALRDGGDIHPVFLPNFASCSNINRQLQRVQRINIPAVFWQRMEELLEEFCEQPDVSPNVVQRTVRDSNWPLGHPDCYGNIWEDPLRLAYIDWAISKLEGELNEQSNNLGEHE